MRTFRGGIHLYEGKELTEHAEIRAVKAAEWLIFPLAQHKGKPADPVVAVGDRVLRGQPIAASTGTVSACICSSVSGTVKAIEERPTVSGSAPCIVIQNDFADENAPGLGDRRDFDTLSAEAIRRLIAEAGVVGMGGAGFPTTVKLTPPSPDDIRQVIINGAECEPYLTSDDRLMVERPDKLIGGLRVMLRLFPKARGVIAVEDNKPDAIACLQERLAGDDRITVYPLKTKYPQGGERLLLHVVTGSDISSRRLPSDAGCVVHNVATAVAVYDAVCESTPLISRVVTLSGEGLAAPGNYEVPIGTRFADLLAATGGLVTIPKKMVAGGPMTGVAFTDEAVPVTKTTGGFVSFLQDDVSARPTTACIRCGRCVSVCPSHLVPQMLATNAGYGEIEKFEKLYGMECIECGCCSYVCPAYRPLLQAIRLGKQAVREKAAKA